MKNAQAIEQKYSDCNQHKKRNLILRSTKAHTWQVKYSRFAAEKYITANEKWRYNINWDKCMNYKTLETLTKWYSYRQQNSHFQLRPQFTYRPAVSDTEKFMKKICVKWHCHSFLHSWINALGPVYFAGDIFSVFCRLEGSVLWFGSLWPSDAYMHHSVN